jgi:hypothetical protein
MSKHRLRDARHRRGWHCHIGKTGDLFHVWVGQLTIKPGHWLTVTQETLL